MTTGSTTSFDSLNLIPELLEALRAEGYTEPTPIQVQAIPHVLAQRDLLGCAQTGTGKTAAFALPILQLLSKKPGRAARNKIRVLVLTPTRELAAQIGESFDRYGSRLGHVVSVIFGGVGQGAQVQALRSGTDILVATPGRLLDLMEQRHVDIGTLEVFVLDEADRMLDMGFIHDVRRVIRALPRERQSLFFSATMPPDIQRLARDILSDPVKVEVTPVATTAEKIDQSVFFVEKDDKRALLEHLMRDPALARTLVFTRTKHGANKVAEFLERAGIAAAAIHGNKSQNNRIRALNSFKDGSCRVLVATDIAARGIDIDGVTHVVNFDLPNIPESYVHRIGRTARAGAEGISLSFCDREEREFLRDIERLIRQKIRVVEEHPFLHDPSKPRPPRPAPQASGPRHHSPRDSRPQRSHAPRTQGGTRPHRAPRAQGAGSSQGERSQQGRPSSSRQQSQSRSQSNSSSARPQAHRGQGRTGQTQRRSESSKPARSGERRPSEREALPAKDSKPWWKRLVGSK